MTAAKRTAYAAASLVAALGIASPFVVGFEGERLTSYPDTNNLPTICNGNIRYKDGTPVKLGQTATKEQCAELLNGALGLSLNVVRNSIYVPLSPYQLAGLASFTYNVGSGSFINSTLRKKINAGDIIGGCNQLRQWVFVNGKDCRLSRNNCAGIVSRREAERDLCLRLK